MLPSPRWPNGSGRAPGNELDHRRVGLADEGRHVRDRHRDVVLDRAADLALHLAEHFADAPERFGLIEISAIAASATSPRSTPSARIASIVSRKPVRACDDNSISTYQDALSLSGSRAPASYFSTASMPSRTISSNDVMLPPLCSLAMPSSSSAASGDATPTNAVSTERGRGIRRSVAAVMMPSVPSAPMNRFFRS